LAGGWQNFEQRVFRHGLVDGYPKCQLGPGKDAARDDANARQERHIEALKSDVASEFTPQNIRRPGLNLALERGNQDVSSE
jgi:hypothetical protein